MPAIAPTAPTTPVAQNIASFGGDPGQVTAGNEMGWWVANDFDRFDPHTVDRITDEVAGWTIRFTPAERRQLPRRPKAR